MNKKKILQIMLAALTLAGGIALTQEVASATPVDQNNFIKGALNAPSLQKGQVINVTSNLRVRSGADSNSSVLGYLNNGADINITAEEGKWYKITFKGQDAFIHQDYVKLAVSVTAETNLSIVTTGQKGQVVNISSTLNIRQGASTSATILGTLKNGDAFEITSKSGGWYKIKSGSIAGFISGDYVKEISSTTVTETPKVTETTTGATSNGIIINVKTNLRIRATANASGSILGYILNGTKVTVTGENGSWYQIKYNNTSAYVSKEYVQKDSNATPVAPVAPVIPVTPPTASTSGMGKVVNISSSLTIRGSASASGKVVGSATNGTVVTITGESGDWYQIDYNKSKAYVFKQYIEKTKTTTTPSNPNPGNTSGGATTGGSENTTEQKGQVINVESNLRIRAQANTSSNVLGYLTNGKIVIIKGKTSNWYKISNNGIEGYINDSYIKILGGSAAVVTPISTETSETIYNKVLNAMKAHIGTPYVWGGSGEYLTTPLLNTLKNRYPYQTNNGSYVRAATYADKGYRAFDCSGLMQWGFKQVGISLGRSTWDQIGEGVEVPLNQIKPGDLLFYSSLQHVGMYIGNGQWIEAPNKNADVRISQVPLTSVGRARRVLK